MNAETVVTIFRSLDRAERILSDVRLFPNGGTLKQHMHQTRQTLAQVRQHPDEVRALA